MSTQLAYAICVICRDERVIPCGIFTSYDAAEDVFQDVLFRRALFDFLPSEGYRVVWSAWPISQRPLEGLVNEFVYKDANRFADGSLKFLVNTNLQDWMTALSKLLDITLTLDTFEGAKTLFVAMSIAEYHDGTVSACTDSCSIHREEMEKYIVDDTPIDTIKHLNYAIQEVAFNDPASMLRAYDELATEAFYIKAKTGCCHEATITA